ncbi:ABC transporter ATP-binding protein [SAR202 cluster bacterium AC-647-N09_OGT_505m]|nr:ABC transporter ATP-binding protein [SAR202 cluster bacterium AC-647-N09_OGT_505m]
MQDIATTPMIEINNLTKYYGEFLAVENLSFTVNKGEIVGLLGPNGAGKTTTMRVLTGFMPPTSGSAKVAGFDVVSQSLEARRRIGYLPETVPLYTEMSVVDYLDFMGNIRGMNKQWRRRRISDVIGICRLEEYRSSLIGKLSKGFRQRVGIAQAILHEPEILIMDEPTIGIDPIQVVETRNLIKSFGGEHTVILSTHILPEVSMVCERVIIIHEGEVVAIDRPDNLSERLKGTERIEVDIRGPAAQVMTALRDIPGVQEVTRTDREDVGSYNIESTSGADLREHISNLVFQSGWGLLRLQPIQMSLEEIFLRLTTTESDSV